MYIGIKQPYPQSETVESQAVSIPAAADNAKQVSSVGGCRCPPMGKDENSDSSHVDKHVSQHVKSVLVRNSVIV